jgi:hypothetical protein
MSKLRRRKAAKPKSKPRVSLEFKIKSSRSYGGELGISQEKAWKRLWPEDFRRKR